MPLFRGRGRLPAPLTNCLLSVASAVIGSLLPAPVAAHAQSQPLTRPTFPQPESDKDSPNRVRRHPYYFALYTGGSAARASDLHLIQPAFGTDVTYHGVNWAGKPQTDSPYYGFKIGYHPRNTPHVGFEFEYNHVKIYAKIGESKRVTGTWQNQPINTVEPISDRVAEYRITNGINTLALNVSYRVPLLIGARYPDGRLQPYVGAGPQYFVLYSINQVAGLHNRDGYRPDGWGYQLFAGTRYLLAPRFGLFAEVKYQSGTAHSVIADRGSQDGGRGETTLAIAHVAAGLFYDF